MRLQICTVEYFGYTHEYSWKVKSKFIVYICTATYIFVFLKIVHTQLLGKFVIAAIFSPKYIPLNNCVIL